MALIRPLHGCLKQLQFILILSTISNRSAYATQRQTNLFFAARRDFTCHHRCYTNGVLKDEESKNEKPKSSTKTKKAKTLARIINSKPWTSDIELLLSSHSSSLSRTTVDQTLRLIKAPSKALHFFDWVRQLGFAHDDQSFFLMLEILGRDRNLNAARNFLFSIERRSNGSVKLNDRFFNSLIRRYGGAGLFQESVKLFVTMKGSGISPSVVTFNNLLSLLLQRGRTNMAHSLFDEMRQTYGVTPDAYTFNILIKGFCRNSMVDEGFRFFNEMRKFNCHPGVITYNTLADGLCRQGKVRIAHNLVKGMATKSPDLSPNVVTYTTLVRGYCMEKQVDDALAVFEEMIGRGLEPNSITYNTLLKGLCEAQNYDIAKELLARRTEEGTEKFAPDTCTLNTLINAHCSGGNLNEALKVFESMPNLNVVPDSATYSVLIRSLCQTGDFAKAEDLFDELYVKEILINDAGCKPLVAAYSPMFEYLCANGKTKKAERVFRHLLKRGAQDPYAYETLIMGHYREGTFAEAYELLVLMLRRNFLPGFHTYDSLINGLLRKCEPVLALHLLEKMLKSAHLPRASTIHSVLSELLKQCHAHESASLLTLMLERQIRLSITLSTDTLKLLFGKRLREKALQLLGLLYENGYEIGMEELVCFLYKSRKLSDASKMLKFSLEKHQVVNTETCNTVLEGLCKSKKLSEAFTLYHELVEAGKYQGLGCLEILRNSLEAGGRSDEALFVSKRMQMQGQLERAPLKF